MKHARVKIGISTYNDRGFLPILLQSIRWYTFLNEALDIVVCDDGSTPEFKKKTQETCDEFDAFYIEHETNQGIPTTWNHLSMSLNNDAEIIVLLNNDLLMPPNWLYPIVHFLDANESNVNVGSVFWNPVNQVPMEAMRAFLPNLCHTSYYSEDTATGKSRDFLSEHIMKLHTGEGQGLGRVMCPCGACFAFRRQVFDEVGPFDERLTSFHEESLPGDRYVVYKDTSDCIHVNTLDELFSKYQDKITKRNGKEYVFNPGIFALSANAKTDSKSTASHCLTEKELFARLRKADGETLSDKAKLCADRAARKLDAAHANVGVWDNVEYLVRHTTEKALVRSKNKFGETVTTPDHSLIVFDKGKLVEAKPQQLNGRSLERVNEFPITPEQTVVDLFQYVHSFKGIQCDDNWIWYAPKRAASPHKILRYVQADTPEMDALCLLVGGYVSEGSMQQYNKDGCRQVHVWCGNDIHQRDVYARAFELLFNVTPTLTCSKKTPYADVHAVVSGIRVITYLFEGMCNIGCKGKRLPNFTFTLPELHKVQVLNALISGDGFRPKEVGYYYRTQAALDDYFLYTTQSRGLVADLSVLLAQLGIRYTIGYREAVNAYWIRSAIKFYGPRGSEVAVTEAEPAGQTKYVYDLGTKSTHRFVDAHGLILVHNSDWGTRCAFFKKAAFGFSYPRPYHGVGQTFAANPELTASWRMKASRALYRQIWNVPEYVADNKYFDYVNEQLMPQIPKTLLKFLRPDYSLAPEKLKSKSGAECVVPQLVEVEGEF